MTAFECSCGWVDGQDNGAELHSLHMRHVLLAERNRQEASGFPQPPIPPDHVMDPVTAPRRSPPASDTPPVQLQMAKDSFDDHIVAQPRPFGRSDFPPGAQGLGWEVRSHLVDAGTWASLLAGGHTSEDITTLLRQWWDDSPEGAVPWPA